ncbi:MAG: hypothetical protein WC401_05180 [Bacteroidales bacterium]|jgi:hypothetical protein
MARKNIPLTIHQPGNSGISSEITFASVAAEDDLLCIPRRYPFADIANLSALRTAGYFRHELIGGVMGVSGDLGGSSTTNTEGTLGFQLPRTEKLVLLVRRTGVPATEDPEFAGGTAKHKFVIKGSEQYDVPDTEVEWAADETFLAGTKIYEIDLYNFGLYISGEAGEDGLTIVVTDDESTPALEFALIARM